MAGRGPAPKDPDTRARRNDDGIAPTPLRFVRARQPKLPAGTVWHARTKAWWAVWGASPQAERFITTDWNFLLDTAALHNMMWSNQQWGLANEIRLRVAKFGATPEDRARLRMQFVQPGLPETDAKRPASKSARERYSNLRVVPPLEAQKAARRPPAKKAPHATPAKAARTPAKPSKKATPVKPPARGAKKTVPAKKQAPAVTRPSKRSGS